MSTRKGKLLLLMSCGVLCVHFFRQVIAILLLPILLAYFIVVFVWSLLHSLAFDADYYTKYLLTGDTTVSFRFTADPNIRLRVQKDFVSILIPRWPGPYNFISLEAYLPDMVTKKQFYSAFASAPDHLQKIIPVSPDRVLISLSVAGFGQGQTSEAAFHDTIKRFIQSYDNEIVSDNINGYVVYKPSFAPVNYNESSLYVPLNQTFYIVCDGYNEIDNSCELNFLYKIHLQVSETISPKYIFQASTVIERTQTFLNSVYTYSP